MSRKQKKRLKRNLKARKKSALDQAWNNMFWRVGWGR
jgi:hypothetical protein